MTSTNVHWIDSQLSPVWDLTNIYKMNEDYVLYSIVARIFHSDPRVRSANEAEMVNTNS